MQTGILLLTHDKIAPAMLATAKMILQKKELHVRLIEAPADCDTEAKTIEARQQLAELDQGQGVLILNDIFGATPFNIAKQLENNNVCTLSGLNLNMLMRALTYQSLPLKELAEKTREGGINGVRYAE